VNAINAKCKGEKDEESKEKANMVSQQISEKDAPKTS